MAGKPLKNKGRLLTASKLGKEFLRPNISSPWLMKVHPDISCQVGLKASHCALLDESCISDVMRNPSIALVESVEAFALGQIDNPFGRPSVKPGLDLPTDNLESQDLSLNDTEYIGLFSAFSNNQIAQLDARASVSESSVSSNNPQYAFVKVLNS